MSFSLNVALWLSFVNEFRSLWQKENELSAEIERLKAEVVKAEKSLDHATPGVSDSSNFVQKLSS